MIHLTLVPGITISANDAAREGAVALWIRDEHSPVLYELKYDEAILLIGELANALTRRFAS